MTKGKGVATGIGGGGEGCREPRSLEEQSENTKVVKGHLQLPTVEGIGVSWEPKSSGPVDGSARRSWCREAQGCVLQSWGSGEHGVMAV